jgi:hypothetical protein
MGIVRLTDSFLSTFKPTQPYKPEDQHRHLAAVTTSDLTLMLLIVRVNTVRSTACIPSYVFFSLKFSVIFTTVSPETSLRFITCTNYK